MAYEICMRCVHDTGRMVEMIGGPSSTPDQHGVIIVDLMAPSTSKCPIHDLGQDPATVPDVYGDGYDLEDEQEADVSAFDAAMARLRKAVS